MNALALAALLLVPAARAAVPSRVYFDERLELLAALRLAAHGAPQGLESSPYAVELGRAVAGQREHRAVAAFKALEGEGYGELEWLFIRGLTPKWELDVALAAHAPLTPARASAFLEQALDFRLAAGLDRFPARRAALRGRYVRALEGELRAHDHAAVAVRYAGFSRPFEQRLLVSPLLREALNYTGSEDGKPFVVFGCGLESDGKDGPRFGWKRRGPRVWQEVAHVLLDPLTDAQRPRLSAMSGMDAVVRGEQCGGWPACARETVARGVAARLGERAGIKPPAGGRSADRAVLALCAALRDYERDRARYPSLEAFYPKLLEALERL